MTKLHLLKTRIFGVDPESVAAYHTVLPRNIHVDIKEDGGYFIAKVDEVGDSKIEGLLITEAQSMDDLINNVNDLIFTYVNMPESIRPYYGNVFKPEGYKKNAKELTLVKA